MTRRAAPAVLLLAVLALFGWVALRSRAGGRSPAGAAEPRDYVVRVVTDDGAVPVQGVRVKDLTRGNSQVTDAAGRVRFDALAPSEDGDDAPELRVQALAPRATVRAAAPGETVLRVPRPVPLEVRFVDAETGAELPALACRLGGAYLCDEAQSSAALRLLGSGAAYEFELMLDELSDGSARPTRSVLRRRGRLSQFATSARFAVALPRAARILVHVADGAGAPVADTEVQVQSASSDLLARARTDAHGDARPEGVPHYRGERLSVSAHQGLRGTETCSLLLGPAEDEHVVRLALDREWRVDYHVGGNGSQSRRAGAGRRAASSGAGSLVVRVLLREGRAAAGLRVRLRGPWGGGRRVDASGVARFDGLTAGTYAVSCTDVAMLGLHDEVTLAEGEHGTLTLTEERGVPLELRVEDASGHGLAGAEVTVADAGGSPWAVVRADGTQELALFTDADGMLRLAEGPPHAQVVAVYGTRQGSTSADEHGRATVVVE